ncbi:MAG: low molecular weight phosphotyrosine protein phosphatase [Leadbetterella sp.]|nr:low molecular weight phosphotyrosine protein phosphatase [Leadbetterella sp.]
MVNVLYVCLGNICRSPLGEATFNQLVREKGLEQWLQADSAGTAGYHVGKYPDPRSVKVAAKHGIQLDHVVRKITEDDLDKFDHIAVMDEENFEFLHRLYYDTKGVPPSADKLFLIRDFDPEVRGVHDVKDPYFEGDEAFEEVFQVLKRSNEKLVEHLTDKYGIEPEEPAESEA